jgi:transcriptional regulator with XRE-family HTH domain
MKSLTHLLNIVQKDLRNFSQVDEMLVKPFSDLGGAVRAVRLRRRLTLRALAGATDLSESFLSQFERGLTQCSVASLRRIAEALGVELAQLFDVEGGAKGRVLRAAARPAISFGHFAVKQLLTPIGPKHVEVFSVRFETGGSTGDNQYIHGDSDEFLLVQSGSVRLHLANDVFRLDEGDSIVFRSSVPHRVVNSNEGPSTVLWVISPPSRGSTSIVSDSKPDRANAI